MNKYLFCTDGSKISYGALSNFRKWVKDYEIDILSVADLGIIPDNTSLEASEFAMYCTKSVEKILDYTNDILQENGIPVGKKEKMCGSVVDAILDTEENNDYQIIILGSNGKRGLQKWLGSVSQEVAGLSKTSVYISKSENEAQKVLFTVDYTQESFTAIKKAVELLDLTGKEIHIVNVYEMPDYVFLEGNMDPYWLNEIELQQEKYGLNILNQTKELFNGLNIASMTLLKGTPAQEIIDYAQKRKIDLVVTGMRKRKHFARFILGSVSKRIIENISTDCLVIKP